MPTFFLSYHSFRMLRIVLIPLTLHLLPVYHFTIGHGLGLTQRLIALLALSIAFLHSSYRSIIKHMDYPTAYTFMQLHRAKGLTLDIEIRNIKFEYRTQCMAHHLLLVTIAGHLASEQFADNIYLTL